MKHRYVIVAAVVAAASVLLVTGALGARSSARKPEPLFSVLLGKNEISPAGKKRAGDRNGRGSATAIIEGGQFCWGIAVANIDNPVAAHVHRGRRNENGPIVIPLDPPSGGDPGASSGCEGISSSLARAIRRNPGRYYFNVHTARFPAGAIRGQIFSGRK